jgi:ubiquitin thioesterase OTU1
MRVRLKGPAGAATLTLAEDATVGNLIDEIARESGVARFEVKHGYPPQPLSLTDSQRLDLVTSLDVKLNGETLTIIPVREVDSNSDTQASQSTQTRKVQEATETRGASSAFGMQSGRPKEKSMKPISLSKQAMAEEVPELPLPELGATLGTVPSPALNPRPA